MTMTHRRVLALVATCAIALIATPGRSAADTSTAAPPSAFVSCDASVTAAQAGPGLYAIATTVREPLGEVDVRLDGATAHWIYTLTSPHALLAIPDQGEALGIAVVGTRHADDAPVACGPQVGQIAGDIARARILDAVPQGVPAVQPTSSAVDPPLNCAHPFVPASTVHAAYPSITMWQVQQRLSGIVLVEVDIDPNSRTVATSVASSTRPALNENALAAARASTFHAPTYRCQPMGGSYIFTVEFDVQ
jgi:TonB family protein